MAETTFGERLHALRKQAHLTQQDVADTLNIHRTTYTKYERGIAAPDHQGLVILAQLFDVSVDFLVGNRVAADSTTETRENTMSLSLQEQMLVQIFRQIGYTEQQALVRQIQDAFRRQQSSKN